MPENGQREREQRILDAAADLIAHYGYDKTTVDEIAQEAGVSKGAIYLHFKSKIDLFEALLLRESEAITERFFALLDAAPGGVTLFNIYRYGLVVLDESPLLKAIYLRDRRVLGDYAQRLRDLPAYAQAMNMSVEFVRHWQEMGLIRRDLDPEVVTYLLSALRYGVLTMDAYTPEAVQAPSVADLGSTLAEMLASGLAPRDGEGDAQAARESLEQLMRSRIQFMKDRQQRA